MHPVRRRRLMYILLIVFGAGIALSLALYALSQNINLYYTPSQVADGVVPKNQLFRIGGLVKNGSIHYAAKGLTVSFVLTDHAHDVPVIYHGVLPDLFREGQGIVSQGRLDNDHRFVADQVLAKHGANYMPPSVVAALKQAQGQLQKTEKDTP